MVKNAEKFAKLVNSFLLCPTGKFFGLLHGSSSDSTSLDARIKFIISFWWEGRWYFNSAKLLLTKYLFFKILYKLVNGKHHRFAI